MNRDGSGLTRLTDDWRTILILLGLQTAKKLYSHPNAVDIRPFKIYILDIETKSVERITNGQLDMFPEWSPDGNLIIFQSTREHSQDFYIIDVKTKKEKRITYKTTPQLPVRHGRQMDYRTFTKPFCLMTKSE